MLMNMSNADKFQKRVQVMTKSEQFSKLLSELGHCREDEQMQKIEEINKLVEKMNEKDFRSIFTKELFKKIHKMIEERKLSMKNALLLLKHVGHCKELKRFYSYEFSDSFFCNRFHEMIKEEAERKEEERKEEENDRLLVDLCECFFLLGEGITSDFPSIYVPFLLKTASKKEENEETQKEVEISLLTLSCITAGYIVEQKLYLDEITEIIKYHQEHQNLTRLAYRSAWRFLINRLHRDESLENVMVNELHFLREATKELEELSKCVDWTRKEEEEKENGRIEVHIIFRWIDEIFYFFRFYTLWNEELVGLINSIVQVFRLAKDNYPDTSYGCISSLERAIEKRNVKNNDLLESRAFGLFLEEMKQSTLQEVIMCSCLHFFLNVAGRLNKKMDGEMDETKRNALKRKVFDRMEEEGCEDIITSFHEFLKDFQRYLDHSLSLNVADYFVNV